MKNSKNQPAKHGHDNARASGQSPGRGSAASGDARGFAATDAGGEPTVQRTPFPAVAFAALCALVYWASAYLLEFGGQADARVHYPYHSFKQIDDFQPKGEEELMRAKGLIVYNRICVGCHQNDGNGSASQNAPPLAGSEWVVTKDPSRIIRIVLHGLSGPITVKGKEWGAGQMLAWKDTMTDEDIALVLSYVRNSWGNKAPAVKPEQVKKTRDETKDHVGYMTAADLMKVTLQE